MYTTMIVKKLFKDAIKGVKRLAKPLRKGIKRGVEGALNIVRKGVKRAEKLMGKAPKTGGLDVKPKDMTKPLKEVQMASGKAPKVGGFQPTKGKKILTPKEAEKMVQGKGVTKGKKLKKSKGGKDAYKISDGELVGMDYDI